MKLKCISLSFLICAFATHLCWAAPQVDDTPGAYAITDFTFLGAAAQANGVLKLTTPLPSQVGNVVSHQGFCANEWEVTWESNAGNDGAGTGAGLGMWASKDFHETSEWLNAGAQGSAAVNAMKSFSAGQGTAIESGRPSDNYIELFDFIDSTKTSFLTNPIFRFKGKGWVQNTFHYRPDGTGIYTVTSPSGQIWSISGRLAHQPAMPFHIGFQGRTTATNINDHQIRNIGFSILASGHCGLISSSDAENRVGFACGFSPECSDWSAYLTCASNTLVQLRDVEQIISQSTFDLLTNQMESKSLYCNGFNQCSADSEAIQQQAYQNGFSAGQQSIDQNALHEAGRQEGYSSGFSAGQTAGYSSGLNDGKVQGFQQGFNQGQTSGQIIGYQNGYSAGLTTGQTTGYSSGYSAGETAGQAAGYQTGYAAGDTAGQATGYQNGYSAGETAGQASGYQSGYAAGDTAGQATGYQNGYSAGNTAGIETGRAEGFASGFSSGKAEGYTSGFNAGESSGHAAGYDEGFAAGDDSGFNRGYANGVEDGEVTGYQNGFASGLLEGQGDLEQAKQQSYSNGFNDGKNSVVCQTPAEGDPQEHPLCSKGATEVLMYNAGDGHWLKPVLAKRSDPNRALGVPQNNNSANFVSLGRHGFIDLGFGGKAIYDKPGNDLRIVETSTKWFSKICKLSPEYAEVFATQNGRNWVSLGKVCQDGDFDLATGGLRYAIALRIVDHTERVDLDGFDLDGIGCPPAPKPTPTPSPTPTPKPKKK